MTTKKKNTVSKPSNKPTIKSPLPSRTDSKKSSNRESLDIHTNISEVETPPGRSTPPATPLTSQRNTQVTIFEDEDEEIVINSENETEYNTAFVEEDDEIQININPKKPTVPAANGKIKPKKSKKRPAEGMQEGELPSAGALLNIASALLLKAVVLLAEDTKQFPTDKDLVQIIGIKDLPESMEQFGNTVVYVDVTDSEKGEWRKLSACYPHGHISVPGSTRWTSMTAEGVWNALKVFTREGVDLSRLSLPSPKGMTRTSGATTGTFVGFAKSLDYKNNEETWDLNEAVDHILATAYKAVLKQCDDEIGRLVAALKSNKPVIIVDHLNPSAPLSSKQRPLVGSLLKMHLKAQLHKKPSKKKAVSYDHTDKSETETDTKKQSSKHGAKKQKSK